MKTFYRAALLALTFLSPAAAHASGLGGTLSPIGTAPYTLNANGAAPAAASAPVVQALDQPVSSANTTAKISVNANTSTLILAHSGSLVTYITEWDVIVAAAVNAKLVYGTGTNCGTGTTDLTGLYPWQVAGSGIHDGDGAASVITVPAGQDLCMVPDTAVLIAGKLNYQRR